VEVTSFATNLDKAAISWYLNGKLQKKGTGEKNFQFVNGENGKTTALRVVVSTSEGDTLEKLVSFTPAEIDLLWQSSSYTPPFYKGKALFTYQDTITVTALPQFRDNKGKIINPKNLIYTWRKDGEAFANLSGFGKNTFTFSGKVPIRPIEISVAAETADGKIRSEARSVFRAQDPEITFYEENPALGIAYHNSLESGIFFSGSEQKIVAVPYFFTSKNPGNALKYKWKLNGRNIASAGESVSIRNDLGESGISDLSLSIENIERIFQFAKKNLRIGFGDVIEQ